MAQAVQFQDENKPDEAIEALKSALLVESGNDQLWQDLADAYLKYNQLDQAADTFIRLSERLEEEGRMDRALQIILSASERLSKLQYAGQFNLLRIQARLELKSGSPEQALLTYQKIVRQEPNHSEHWFQLAQLADERQREEQALEAFRKAAELFADTGQSNKAGQCLRRALELTPEDTELRLHLASLLEQSGERSESVNQRLQVAKILTATDSLSQAMSSLEPIFEVQPDHLQALEQWLTLAEEEFLKDSSSPEGSILLSRLDRAFHLVNLYKNQGLLGKAGQLLEHLQKLFPEEQSVLRSQIDFFRETGATPKAISLLLGLSRRYQEQERWEDALQCLQEARTSFPSATSDQPNILEAELKVHQARGDVEAQCALMMNLADLSADRGLIGKQISYLVQAWNLQPQKTEIGESLAEIHLAKGDESAAIDVFLQLIEKNREAGRPDAVREGYERILNTRPALVQVRFELAQQLIKETQKEDACRHLKRITEQLSGQLPPADPELIPVLEQTYKHLIELAGELNDYLGLGTLYQAIQDYPAAGCAYLEALEHCPAEQPEKAIEICRQILEIAPGESAVENRLADLYLQQGYKNEAARILHSLWNRYWRSFSLWLKSPEGQTQIASGALVDRIHETAEELLALEPENAQIHQQIVEFYSTTGNPEQAIPHLIILGEIFTERGDKNQATQTYRQILEIHPGSTSESLEVRIRLAEVLESQGQVSEALHEYLVLGDTYEEQNLWDEAQTAFQRAVDIAPDNQEALKALLRIAKQQNQPEKVKKLLLQLADLRIDEKGHLEAYLELDDQDRIVRERYVQTLAQAGLVAEVLEQTNLLITASQKEKQYDLALSLLDRIKEQFPQQIELYEMSVQVLEQQLRHAKRNKIPNTLVDRINRQLNTQRLDFAELLETAGDLEAASNLLSKICQSDSENEIARRRLIALLETREEKDPADQKTASTLWQQLGDLLSRRGQLDEAGSAYAKALELSPRSRNVRQRLTTLNSERGLVEDAVAGQRQLARQALEEENWDQAVEAYEEISTILT